MTTPKIFKSQTLDFGPAMPLKLSKKPTENEPHVAKMRWFNLGSWTAVVLVQVHVCKTVTFLRSLINLLEKEIFYRFGAFIN